MRTGSSPLPPYKTLFLIVLHRVVCGEEMIRPGGSPYLVGSSITNSHFRVEETEASPVNDATVD